MLPKCTHSLKLLDRRMFAMETAKIGKNIVISEWYVKGHHQHQLIWTVDRWVWLIKFMNLQRWWPWMPQWAVTDFMYRLWRDILSICLPVCTMKTQRLNCSHFIFTPHWKLTCMVPHLLAVPCVMPNSACQQRITCFYWESSYFTRILRYPEELFSLKI